MSSFTDSFRSVSEITSKFKANEDYYLSPKYQESEARQDFIDKFWVALGWDVYHHQNINPYEREVRIEKSVVIDGRGKRADYAFFTAPNFSQAKFLAEAKKPARNLENNQDCFQAIRYGWNSNTPLAVLTDFEQFLILDSRYKPSIEHSTDRILKKYHYSEFTDQEKFSEIYFLFAREAVLDNSLEKFAESIRSYRGARQTNLFNFGKIKPFDEEFLNELDEYRLLLARAFIKNNPSLNSEDLTEITQRTLDRLVLTRFLVDKVIEEHEIIDGLGSKSGDAWADFCSATSKLNSQYNGAIFRENILLDVKKVKPSERDFEFIRDALAEKNSSYDFNIIPIHILGSIYERFLGNAIVVDGNKADITQKPEVRKAGGVYYTPEYIVNYIVENTIGKLIDGKTPEEIAEMRFADISCGSGSFLLGVYDYLLKYHLTFYLKNKTALNKAIKNGMCIVEPDNTIHLSIKHRRSILTNNIYGVDIDAQAVEVTKLSLYLKMLEDAKTGAARSYQLELGERLLPSLNENIVFGNSIIDLDVTDGVLIDTQEFKLLNPLSFQSTFSDVFRYGGFDAIVGNPPYGADLTEVSRKYLKKKFEIGTTDTAALMMIQAINLTKEASQVGLIVPKSFTYSSTWAETRNQMVNDLETLVDCGKVWKEVKLEQVVCIFSNQAPSKYSSFKREKEDFQFIAEIPKDEVMNFGFYLNGLTSKEISIGRKIFQTGTFLGDFTKNTRGGMFQKLITSEKTAVKVIGGKQINRFSITGQKGFIVNKEFLPLNSFVKKDDLIVQNIVAHIMKPYEHIKVIGTVIDDESYKNLVILDTVNRLTNFSEMSSYFLLALLHSKLVNWYIYCFIFAKAIRTMHFDAPVSDKLPIPKIDFNNPKEKNAHNKIVSLVEKILEAKQHLSHAHTDKDKAFYERYCDSLDKQIDDLVFDLYGLSDDERAIVKNSV